MENIKKYSEFNEELSGKEVMKKIVSYLPDREVRISRVERALEEAIKCGDIILNKEMTLARLMNEIDPSPHSWIGEK